MIISQDTAASVPSARDILARGDLVAIPTETVYGLAADATNEAAVKKIYTAKGRPSHNPLICHVASRQMAERYVMLDDQTRQLMDHFWPGPLTFVAPIKADQSKHAIAPSVTAGLKTLAVRCPANKTVQDIITALDRPIAAPSANPSGKISPTTAHHVFDGLGDKISLIIDGGACTVGIESTIISVIENKIILLRPGTIDADSLSDISGLTVTDHDGSTITAPGQLSSHYAPDAPVILNSLSATDEESFTIGFGEKDGNINLSPTADLSEAAHNLFDYLKQADKSGKRQIKVRPIPNQGIGIAINDRLTRAAAPRD